MADLQWTTTDTGTLGARSWSLFRHAFWQIDSGKGIKDPDVTDEAAFDIGFIGNGTNNLAWLDAMLIAHLDAEALGSQIRMIPSGRGPAEGDLRSRIVGDHHDRSGHHHHVRSVPDARCVGKAQADSHP